MIPVVRIDFVHLGIESTVSYPGLSVTFPVLSLFVLLIVVTTQNLDVFRAFVMIDTISTDDTR